MNILNFVYASRDRKDVEVKRKQEQHFCILDYRILGKSYLDQTYKKYHIRHIVSQYLRKQTRIIHFSVKCFESISNLSSTMMNFKNLLSILFCSVGLSSQLGKKVSVDQHLQ